MQLTVSKLQKSFGAFQACKEVSFELEKGRLFGLLGPSGGGKTTILRMLAGLEYPDSGDIYFNGQRVNNLPPQQRNIGFVFQNYALFRHMTVWDNIAFGLKLRKKSKAEIKSRVQHLLELVGLSGMEKRYPHQLSGGQRQRVAFARALAPEPELLLLDEPFAALDAKVRRDLRSWLKEMINRVGITTVFVTHDQEEAVEVADEIMVIHQGKLEQKGTPQEIYHFPQTSFVASFFGETQFVQPGKLKGFHAYNDVEQAIVRPEFVDIGLLTEMPPTTASEKAKVRQVYFRGNHYQIEVEIAGQKLLANRSLELPELQPGDDVNLLIHRLHLCEGEKTRLVENQNKKSSQANIMAVQGGKR